MSDRGRSRSPKPLHDADVDMEHGDDRKDAKVVLVNGLSRSVAQTHIQTIFGFYGEIVKIDLPLFTKSGQNRGKAALEYADPLSAQRAVSHMNGGQLDGLMLKVEISDLPIRARSRSRPRPVRNGRDRRSFSRSRSRSQQEVLAVVALLRGTPIALLALARVRQQGVVTAFRHDEDHQATNVAVQDPVTFALANSFTFPVVFVILEVQSKQDSV
ncbi:hypothetical protein JVT61DRAFT_12764 [Boletus reticuloceps]|uniref:RRM domain-containing protein n=2 Tax=Boletus TaxID=5369 RepID=A0A8I3AAU5_9AGAM|nr:hypothetical protein JVT61DRAFT_12764 [Boletus reticuloceps]